MKKLVLLDFNNILIHSTNHKDKKYDFSFIENNFNHTGYYRPNLKEFLSFLFENYNVGIFTRQKELYAINILKSFLNSNIINNNQYELLISNLLYDNDLIVYKINSFGYECMKSLDIASKKHNVPIVNIMLIDTSDDIDNPYPKQRYTKNMNWEYKSFNNYICNWFDEDFHNSNEEYREDKELLNVINYLKNNF